MTREVPSASAETCCHWLRISRLVTKGQWLPTPKDSARCLSFLRSGSRFVPSRRSNVWLFFVWFPDRSSQPSSAGSVDLVVTDVAPVAAGSAEQASTSQPVQVKIILKYDKSWILFNNSGIFVWDWARANPWIWVILEYYLGQYYQ